MPLPDSDLFGRTVVHASGVRMGRIDAVVHQHDGTRLAVVRRGRILRRWYHVSLDGAQLIGGHVVVSAGYGRGRPHDVEDETPATAATRTSRSAR